MSEEGPLDSAKIYEPSVGCLCLPWSKQEHTNPWLFWLSGVDTAECPDVLGLSLSLSLPTKASILHSIPLPNGSAETSTAAEAAHQTLSPSLSSTGSPIWWELHSQKWRATSGSLKLSFECSHFRQRSWLRLEDLLLKCTHDTPIQTHKTYKP